MLTFFYYPCAITRLSLQIVGKYSEEKKAETDEEEEDIKELVDYTQAIKTLETLKIYKKKQNVWDLKLLEALKRHSKVMFKRQISRAELSGPTLSYHV